MYRDLRQATTPEQKDAIIRRANARLIAIGEDQKARNLMLDRDALVISEAQDFNAANYEELIDNGALTDPTIIDNAEAMGQITPEDKNLRHVLPVLSVLRNLRIKLLLILLVIIRRGSRINSFLLLV